MAKPGTTVTLGAIISVAALIGATLLIGITHPSSAVRMIIVAVALIIGIVGGVMMLKDLTPNRHR